MFSNIRFVSYAADGRTDMTDRKFPICSYRYKLVDVKYMQWECINEYNGLMKLTEQLVLADYCNYTFHMDMDIGWCNGGEELFFNAVRASYTY